MNTLMNIVFCMALLLLVGQAPAAEKPANDDFAGNACVQCHKDLAGRSSEIVGREWIYSVHYKAKVGCDGCHGGHPSVRKEQFASAEEFKHAAHLDRNPEFLLMHREGGLVTAARGRSVSYLCGKCHVQIKEYHLGSPHGEFGQPTCLYCHGGGSHRITPAALDIVDTRSRADGGRCTACHRAATMESVVRIKKVLTDTETRIKVTGEQYKVLEADGYRNLELERLHHHAGEARSQVRQIFHSFNMRDIAKLTTQLESVADRTTAAHELVKRGKNTQRHQIAVGAAAVLFLLSFAGLLIYYKNTYLVHGQWSAEALAAYANPEPRRMVAEEVIVMKGVPLPVSDRPQPASFPQLGICFMIAHFGITIVCLIVGALFSRSSGTGTDGGTLLAHVGQLLCWPLLTLGPMIAGDHPALFWPLMLTNSALWGFALAAFIYPLKRWVRSRLHSV